MVFEVVVCGVRSVSAILPYPRRSAYRTLGLMSADAHPEIRRIVIPVKTELMKLVFMVLRLMIGFYGVLF